MKATSVVLQCRAEIGLDEHEVALLGHITSYDNAAIAKQIEERTSSKYSAKEIRDVLDALKEATAKIIAKCGEARSSAFEDRYSETRTKL